MIVETETYLTLKEYTIAMLRLFYRKPIASILQICGFACLPIVVLWLFRLVNIESKALLYSLIYLAIYSVGCPFYISLSVRKQYKSSVATAHPIIYTFDDTGVSYKAEGEDMGGHFEWKYILKYTVIKNILALYMTSRGVIFIKTNKLKNEEINFILSKIDEKKA